MPKARIFGCFLLVAAAVIYLFGSRLVPLAGVTGALGLLLVIIGGRQKKEEKPPLKWWPDSD